MFDLITGTTNRPLRERSPMSKVVAVIAHVVIVTLVLAIPIMTATNTLPDVPTMMAFATDTPEPPPPPPPPPPPAPPAPKATPDVKPVQTVGGFTAPTEAPAEIRPEPASRASEGVLGGVEGGIAGGVVGGIVGGIVTPAPPPPPPRPLVPAAPAAPVRIGGQLQSPQLVHRVEPAYPLLAAEGQVTGLVILDAIVGTDGCVEEVTVLRGHPLLNRAAIDALKQWQYSPLMLNGTPTRFELTVTFNFSVERSKGARQ